MNFIPTKPLKIYANDIFLNYNRFSFSFNEDSYILDPDISVDNIYKPYAFRFTIADFRVIEREIDGINRFIVEFGVLWVRNDTGSKEKRYEVMQYKDGHKMMFSDLELAKLLLKVAKECNEEIRKKEKGK